MPQQYEIYHKGPEDKTNIIQLNNETIQQTKKVINTLWLGLYADDPLASVRLPQKSF